MLLAVSMEYAMKDSVIYIYIFFSQLAGWLQYNLEWLTTFRTQELASGQNAGLQVQFRATAVWGGSRDLQIWISSFHVFPFSLSCFKKCCSAGLEDGATVGRLVQGLNDLWSVWFIDKVLRLLAFVGNEGYDQQKFQLLVRVKRIKIVFKRENQFTKYLVICL